MESFITPISTSEDSVSHKHFGSNSTMFQRKGRQEACDMTQIILNTFCLAAAPDLAIDEEKGEDEQPFNAI